MADVGLPTQDLVTIGTASTDVYAAASSPSQTVVSSLRFGLMASGTDAGTAQVDIYHLRSGTTTLGIDNHIEQINLAQFGSDVTRSYRLAAGGKIVMTSSIASQVVANLEDGKVFV